MGTLHHLIRDGGSQGALDLGFERLEVEAAAAYLADEDGGVGFLYSGWCQTALPHRRLPDGDGWQIQTERTTLIVEPGMRPGPAGKPSPVGIPYGSRARLILIFLQSEAIKSRSREIELGGSLRSWLARLGIPQGGTSLAAVRDQAERLARCRMTFEVQSGNATGMLSQKLIDGALFVDEPTDVQARRTPKFLERATLSEAFFEALKRHPVPLQEAAIKAVSNNSQALDAYAWLAYRLHSLAGPRAISWRALKVQFGAGVGRLDHFKARFLPNLRLALAVYPEARVDVEDDGIVLHPSRPPVAKEKMVR
jgi:Plasmid encoded RepA protein